MKQLTRLLSFKRPDNQVRSRLASENDSEFSSQDLRRVNISPTHGSGSPTRSRSPWPPVSDTDSEELEVEHELEPSEGDDSSLAPEEILAQLHSGTLDPITFERHALSHISEANEDGTRASVLSRDWASSLASQRDRAAAALGTYDRRTAASTASLLSSDYGGEAVRRASIFADVNRPLSSYSAGTGSGGRDVDIPTTDSPQRRSFHSRAATEPVVERESPTPVHAPIRHTASPVGRRAANLIALFEQQAAGSDAGSISSATSGSSLSSLSQTRARSASLGQTQPQSQGVFSPSASTSAPGGFSTIASNLRAGESASSFPRASNVPSITSSRSASPTKPSARPSSPLKSSITASTEPPPPPPKEPVVSRRGAPLPRTPDTSLQRPAPARPSGKGSPRFPLTSVRNIVAAWGSKERSEDIKASDVPIITSTKPTATPSVPKPADRPFSIGENSFSIRRRAAAPGGATSESGARPPQDNGNSEMPSGGAGEQGLRPPSGSARRESIAPSLHPSEVGSQIHTDREVCSTICSTSSFTSADRNLLVLASSHWSSVVSQRALSTSISLGPCKSDTLSKRAYTCMDCSWRWSCSCHS